MLLLLFPVFTFAQKPIRLSNVRIVKQADGTLKVSFRMNIFRAALAQDQKLIITPCLFEGRDRLRLPAFEVKRRRQEILDARAGVVDTSGLVATIRRNSFGWDVVYRTVSPVFGSDVSKLKFGVIPGVKGCCQVRELALIEADAVVDVSSLARTESVDMVKQPEKPIVCLPRKDELEKLDSTFANLHRWGDYTRRRESFEEERFGGDVLRFHFNSGSAVLDFTFEENRVVMMQLNQILDVIEATPGATLKKIVLAGLTSIEGTYHDNQELGQKRVNALMKELGGRVKKEDFEVLYTGEDWGGLRALVVKEGCPRSAEVLHLIDTVPVMAGLEKCLMELAGGSVYRYLAKNYFPRLRNTGHIQIYYDR